jgi:uncharacterized protein YggT (Ycf19 family)
MKFIKALNKFFEGILFIFLPIIVFYWSLSLVNLDIVKPIMAILGLIIDPMVYPFRPLITYVANYQTYSVDYTVLFFAGLVLAAALLCTLNGHILRFIEEKMSEALELQKEKETLKHLEEEKREYHREVNKNSTIFVALKLIKNQPVASYLIKEDKNDFFSGGLVDSYESSICKAHLKFGGTNFNFKNSDESIVYFIFNDLQRFLDYLPYIEERVQEVNKGMLDLNICFDYKIAAHCAISDASAEADYQVVMKMLNLCAEKEVLLSEILKNRLELKENKNYKLFSRGIYLINDKQMDVYKLQFL